MARNLIVINVDFKETRVALIEDGVIAELQIERAAHRSTVGNIVLGRVTRVLPGMQAAFIDVGQERAAFLHVEDLIRPDDFDAYLAGDARDEQKPQVAGRQAEAPDGDEEGEGDVEHDPGNGNDAAQPAARRGRRRRGRRGRGRPGAESEGLQAALPAGTDQQPPAAELAASSDQLASETDATPVSSRYATQPSPAVHHAQPTAEEAQDANNAAPSSRSRAELPTLASEARPGALDNDEFDPDGVIAGSASHESEDEFELDDDLVAGDVSDEDDDFESDDNDDDFLTAGERDADDEDEVELFSSDDDDDDEELFVRDDGDEDDSDEDDVFGPDDDDSDDDGDDDVFGRDDDDEDEFVDEDDDDADEDADEELFEDGDEASAFVTDDGNRAEIDDASGYESGPESGAFTEVEAVVLTGERPSYVNVAASADDEPPSSGERETTLLADVVQPDVPAAARRNRQRREPSLSPEPSQEVDAEGSAEPDAELDNRKRRGRRRRRRNGRVDVSPLEVIAESAQVVEAPSDDSAPDSDGRRRRRRGRRRGRADSKPEVLVETPASKNGARRMPARVSRSVPISEVVREGNLVVVQISKEPIGTKGARVTSHVSLPGRYVVYLPTVEHVGISKRIGNARERARLRKSIEAIKPAHGGLIVRTVAEGLTKKQLKADIGYLIKVWADVAKRRETAKPAEILYEELDLVLKAARDLFTDEVQQIVIDDRDQHGRLSRFVEMFMPGRVKDIKLYTGDEPIFDAYGIEDEIKRALSRKVPLPSGGSLVMDQAEALTAIDVNTGRYVGKGSKDLEETAFKTNLEAVDEIAYQLRFRNIGGLVILDLIDMEKAENRERVWRTLEQKLAKDKAKTTINRISELGLIEMTRKRTRESLGRVMHEPCFYCDGTGHIQSRETIAYEILRQIRRDRMSLAGYSVRVLAHPAVVDFLKHEARDALQQAERLYLRRIELMPRQEYHIEQYDLQGR